MQLQRNSHPGKASTFVARLTNIWTNAHTILHTDYCIGDWVWLEVKTQDEQPLVKTARPIAKLDSKQFGLFCIIART